MLFKLNHQEKICLLHFSMKEREEVHFISYSDQTSRKMIPITFLNNNKVHMYSDNPSLSKVFDIDDITFIPNEFKIPNNGSLIVDENENLGWTIMSDEYDPLSEEITESEESDWERSKSELESDDQCEWSISSIHVRSEWENDLND